MNLDQWQQLVETHTAAPMPRETASATASALPGANRTLPQLSFDPGPVLPYNMLGDTAPGRFSEWANSVTVKPIRIGKLHREDCGAPGHRLSVQPTDVPAAGLQFGALGAAISARGGDGS